MKEMRKHQEHEAKCQRCGISCHVPVREPGKGDVVVEGLHCKFLRKEGQHFTCTVYPDRYRKAPWCHTVADAAPAGMLRTDCPYNATGKGKVRLSPADYDSWWEERKGLILAMVHPHFVGVGAFLAELRHRDPDREWEAVVHETGGHVFQEKGKPSPFLIVPMEEKDVLSQ